jgi:hypothetical protein
MRREPELGSGSGSVRPKVGDDRWPPPVGDRGRREAEKGLLGRLGGLGGVKRRAELKRSRSGRGLWVAGLQAKMDQKSERERRKVLHFF